jgi:c-di-GMP-related signal transduction protein
LNHGQTADTVGSIYSLVTAYEIGSWETVDDYAQRLALSRQALSTAYRDSVRWAEDIGTL